jgi:hypothetical protein
MTGTRPAATCTQAAMTARCSSALRVATFAGRPAWDERIAALIDLPGDEITEYRFIDSSRRKRGHEGGYRTEKHG